MGFIRDCFTGEDSLARHGEELQRDSRPNCALDSDPWFGTFLIAVLSICVGAVTKGWGFLPFLIWALWMGLKPFDPKRS